MTTKSKEQILSTLLFTFGLSISVLTEMLIDIFYFNSGDTSKWGSKMGAFQVAIFFSSPFILLFSLGNYISVRIFHKLFSVMDKKKLILLQLLNVIPIFFIFFFWDFLINSLSTFGITIVLIGFLVSSTIYGVANKYFSVSPYSINKKTKDE